MLIEMQRPTATPAVSTPVAKARAGNGHHGPIGGRGCIRCGKHTTESFSNTGVVWCHDCGHRWQPCRPGCRGYDLEPHGPLPKIRGCKGCGTPDEVVQRWPEAWRAMAKRLDTAKRDIIANR